VNKRSRRGAIAMLATTATALAMAGGVGANASQPPSRARDAASSFVGGQNAHERKGYYDARRGSVKVMAQEATKVVGSRGQAYDTFTRSLGVQGVVSLDPLTGTPREVAKLNGFLTKASTASARSIVLEYVRAHHPVFGLSRADMRSFRLSTDYVDILGTHHLSWVQYLHGLPVYGNGLRGHVTKDGRLISVLGSPIAGLAAAGAGRVVVPKVSAADARARAVRDVGGRLVSATLTHSGDNSAWSNGDSARLVWFKTASDFRLGWSTYTKSGATLGYQHVIDARTGNVLFRRSTVDFDKGDAYVYDYYPGAAHGGQATVVNLVDRGWIGLNADWLKGKYAYAWSDLNDNNAAETNEKTPMPGTNAGAQFKLVKFQNASTLCSPKFVCTWNPNIPRSWDVNKKADVTNGFYLASNFHDYLKQAPIGFTAQAGNFEAADGDPVLVQALDGANSAGGLPDGNHIDNANMSTPPDGTPPTMQMYLWHFPGSDDTDEPFVPTSSSFDASVLYHEYAHGLSNRLVVDASGNSTLNSIQAGSMGEAWSDYYALDYLTTNGFIHDTDTDGQVREGKYLTAGAPFRTEPIDCQVRSTASLCKDVSGHPGGYTYGDFPLINGTGPEVHASGEVWAQTLWDLRTDFGHAKADMLITRGMELAPADPSMLDMRNAILQADKVAFSGVDQLDIWRAFKHRGMGWYAGAIDAGDAFPAEDFHLPPPAGTPRATLHGKVTDPVSGDPVPGALVSVTGHDSGYIGDYTAVTNANGLYTMNGVLPGTYPKVIVTAPGFEFATTPVNVEAPDTTQDFKIRFDWAATASGGSIADSNGPDFSGFGCGPDEAIDLSQGTGWVSTTGDDNGTPTNVFIPKFIVVHLPETIDISTFVVDPSNTCGDAGSASTGQFEIDTSPDGSTWTTAAVGTFDASNRAKYNEVTPIAGTTAVNFVRFQMLGNQTPDFLTNCPDGNFSGCSFTDLTELEVFGQAFL
jgi:extracellular elastinolytic metalloproteinase